MTIIQPNKQKFHIDLALILSTALFFGGAVWGIFMYNRIVDLRYTLSELENNLEAGQAVNVDLKNQLYQLTDSRQITRLAKEFGLIEEKKPTFVEEKTNVFADISLLR